MRELARAYPETNAKLQGEVLPFWQAPRGPQRMLANALMMLQAVLLLLLLAVCGNTANLLLARASTRRREIGVRLALGAGPLRVAGLLLGAFPIKFQTDLDGTSLAFAMGLGIISGLMFGIAPTLQLARLDPQ